MDKNIAVVIHARIRKDRGQYRSRYTSENRTPSERLKLQDLRQYCSCYTCDIINNIVLVIHAKSLTISQQSQRLYMRDRGQLLNYNTCDIMGNIFIVIHTPIYMRGMDISQRLYMRDHGRRRNCFTCELKDNIAAIIHAGSWKPLHMYT